MSQGFAKAEFADPGWQDYVPTWNNVTVGNGTLVARYQQIGTSVRVRVELIFGSTSSIDGAPARVSLPVTPASDGYTSTISPIGQITCFESGGNVYDGVALYNSGDDALLKATNTASTYSIAKNINTTIPFTWGTLDILNVELEYEAATSLLIGMGLNNDHGSLSGLTDWDHAVSSGRWYLGSNQTVTTATLTTLLVDTENYLDNAASDLSFASGIVTINTAGIYLVTGSVKWSASSSAGSRFANIQKSGSVNLALEAGRKPPDGIIQFSLSTVYKFAAADTVYIEVFQSSGGNLDLEAAEEAAHLSVTRLS